LSSFGNLFIKSALTGAFTVLRCALIDEPEDYDIKKRSIFMEENPVPSHGEAKNEEKIKELIDYSRDVLNEKGIKLTSI
jgi:hypothetical protein